MTTNIPGLLSNMSYLFSANLSSMSYIGVRYLSYLSDFLLAYLNHLSKLSSLSFLSNFQIKTPFLTQNLTSFQMKFQSKQV